MPAIAKVLIRAPHILYSPLKVRTGKAQANEALAQDIAAHGIIYSLSVYEGDGKYNVVAGVRLKPTRSQSALESRSSMFGAFSNYPRIPLTALHLLAKKA